MPPRGITPPKAFMLFQRPFAKIVTPADIFDPALWLRPEDLPASGEISTWIDASGNARNLTQATSANRPVVLDNALNGFSAASFDGVNDSLRTTNFIPMTNEYSYFVVYSHPSTTSNRALFLNGSGLTNGIGYFLRSGLQRTPTHSAVVEMVNANATANVFEIASVVRTSAPLATFEVNGGSQSITSANSNFISPNTGLFVGSRQSDSFFGGVIVEVLIYNKSLNTTERASVTNYLRSKYNL